jgi:hypothetical protein
LLSTATEIDFNGVFLKAEPSTRKWSDIGIIPENDGLTMLPLSGDLIKREAFERKFYVSGQGSSLAFKSRF